MSHPPRRRALTWEQVCELRAKRAMNRFRYTQKALAEEYGLARSTVNEILNGQTYRVPHRSVRHGTAKNLRLYWREYDRCRVRLGWSLPRWQSHWRAIQDTLTAHEARS